MQILVYSAEVYSYSVPCNVCFIVSASGVLVLKKSQVSNTLMYFTINSEDYPSALSHTLLGFSWCLFYVQRCIKFFLEEG